ncbi:MAG: BACON domain-containing protein [Alistipes sp.]|nr:BACON domain-containing protein [Alistipes sp.]
MKKQIKHLMLVAVAAMGFTACNENIDEALRPIEPAEVKMTITADVDATRTYIDEELGKVMWNESDQLKVIENSANYRTTSETVIDANGKAQFTVAFKADETSTSFTYNAIYPADAVTEDDEGKRDVTKIKVTVKGAQNPTATSFDPTSDILVAKQITTNTQPTELAMQFKRLTAIGKLTLKGLPASSTISQVVFTAGAEDILAGRNYVNATTGTVDTYGYHSKTNAITLNYPTPLATRDIYFSCNPFEMEAGETFTVKVICSDYTYTREVTIPAGRSLTFSEGDLNTFTVDMSSATKEDSFSFSDGEYAIIAVKGTSYYAMTNVDNGANTKRLNQMEVAYDGVAETFATTDTSLIWDIKRVDGGYYVQDTDGKYLSWTTGNSAFTGDDAFLLNITPVEGTNTYNITVASDSERMLAKNSSSSFFAFYKGTQEKNLLLVPIVEGGETPEPEPEPEPKPGVVKATIAEFLAAEEDATVYELTGQITSVSNTEYGNFYIKDSTGEVYIYGLCSPEGEQKYWATSGVKVGDTITLRTVRTSHNGTPQGTNAIYVSHVEGEAPEVTIVKATVAEFMAAAESTTTLYELTGEITRMYREDNENDFYHGNFYLKDATGEVAIYGLNDKDGSRCWQAVGLKIGDTITLQTVRASYNGTPQGKDATYISHNVATESISVDKSNVEFSADGGSETVAVTLFNFTATVSAVCDNAHFSVTTSGTDVTITAPANNTESLQTGTVTITAGECSATVAVSQAMKIATGTGEWTLVTNISELAAGDKIVIVAQDYDYALSTTQKTNNRAAASITKSNNTVTIGDDVQIITLESGTTASSYAFNVGNGYLYAASSKSNHLKTETTLSANSSWAITIASSGVATIKATGSNTKNWLRYNPNNDSPIFACYGSGQNDVVIYKQD